MNYDFFLYLLKAGLVLAILTVAYAWLVKRETFLQVNRWLLWINVAATLSLPIIPMPDFEWMPDAPAKVVAEVIPSRQALPDSKPSKKYEELAVTPLPNSKSLENQNAVPISSALTFWDWIGIVYVLVVGLLTLKLVIQLGALWRLKRNGVNYEPEDGVHLIENEKITAPFSFFHWVFYNPTHHNDDEWAQIWAHECIHVHQRHSIDMLTAEAMKIVFWFNPFAWWHQRLVQETLEFITDRAVLASGVEKKSYQYHLLRSTLSADKQTFTNHFNQSLLKNRITMMNRTKSKWLGLGKYGVFIGMLWLCGAFTKPYRAEVAAKIVEKVPELEVVLQPKVAEKAVFNDFVFEALPKPVSATKYVIYRGNRLYWVVTPKVTFQDLAAIQKEFQKIGGKFFVKQMKYDPLGFYLSEVSIKTAYLKGGGSCATDDLKVVDKPISAFGGWIQPENKTCGISDNSWDSMFDKIVEQDKNAIEKWMNDRQSDYGKAKEEAKRQEEDALLQDISREFYKNPLKAHNGFTKLGEDALQYIFQSGARNRIYFGSKGELRVENFYQTADFIIDNQVSTLKQAEQLTYDKIRTVACCVVYTDSTRQSTRRTVAIVTHNYNKL